MDWFIACCLRLTNHVSRFVISQCPCLYFSPPSLAWRYHRAWCSSTWLEQWRINKSRSSPTAGNVCVGPCRKDVESSVFFVMADAVNLPEPKGLPTLLGLNQKWCGIFSDCYMYTGLKGGDCLMDGGFIPWKKSNRDETRIVYGFRLIPKMKDCDFNVYLSATKRGATIRNSKDCMTNDKRMTFIDETHFWESPFSGRGFLVLGFYFLR